MPKERIEWMKLTMYNPNELYHFGVKGMKWGIRRYQNKDGTLTKAGRKRAQKDADSLSKAMSKEMDSTNDFQRSIKRIYLVDKQGNNRWDENGRGYFDAGTGLMKYERDKLMRKDSDAQAYLNIKNTLKQKKSFYLKMARNSYQKLLKTMVNSTHQSKSNSNRCLKIKLVENKGGMKNVLRRM